MLLDHAEIHTHSLLGQIYILWVNLTQRLGLSISDTTRKIKSSACCQSGQMDFFNSIKLFTQIIILIITFCKKYQNKSIFTVSYL